MHTTNAPTDRSSFPTRIVRFFSTDLWLVRPENSPIPWPIILFLRTLLLSVNGFISRDGPLRASALTLYTLLSLVPLVAMAFGIAKGFGFERLLEKELLEQFSAQQDVVRQIIVFARNMLDNTQGGLIAGIGVLVLFWSVIKVLGNIEESFNKVWSVPSRTLLRKMSDYMTIMLTGPILLIMSGSVTVFIATGVSALSSRAGLDGVMSPLIAFGLSFAPYILLWILFALIYLIMPNTKIRISHAFLAAILAGTAYQLLQIAYVRFQIGMTSYNAIYGSFAALPLFLLWLNISWYIVLFGAEIVYALGQVKHPGLPAHNKKELRPAEMRLYALQLCGYVARRFRLGLTAQNPTEIARALGIAPDLANQLGNRLVQAKMLVRIAGSNAALQPAMDVQNLTLARVLEALDNVGESSVAAAMSPMLAPISARLEALRTTMETSPANLPLLEIMETENTPTQTT